MACLTTVKQCLYVDDVVKNLTSKKTKKILDKSEEKKKKVKKDKWRNCKYF